MVDSFSSAHLPASAVICAGAAERGRIPREPVKRVEAEFLKISINIDKFTGFFDK